MSAYTSKRDPPACAVSAYVRLGAQAWPLLVADMLPKALVITLVCQLCLYYGDLYDDPRVAGNRTELLVRILRALGITLLILAGLYTMFPELTVAPGVIVVADAKLSSRKLYAPVTPAGSRRPSFVHAPLKRAGSMVATARFGASRIARGASRR